MNKDRTLTDVYFLINQFLAVRNLSSDCTQVSMIRIQLYGMYIEKGNVWSSRTLTGLCKSNQYQLLTQQNHASDT